MNSQMTAFALPGKCDGRGASGLMAPSLAASLPSCCSSPASASVPNPVPTFDRNCRRVRNAGDGGAKSLGTFIREPLAGVTLLEGHLNSKSTRLFDIHKLIQAQQCLAEIGQSQVALAGFAAGFVRLHLPLH